MLTHKYVMPMLSQCIICEAGVTHEALKEKIATSRAHQQCELQLGIWPQLKTKKLTSTF